MNPGDFRQRLLDRAGRADLTPAPGIVDALETYYRLLTHWNKRINLTSLPLEPLGERSLERLIIEPLMAAAYVQDRPLTWFDLGSGGGSPAIPLKIARPRARLTMVESRSRKAAFLRDVVRELQFTDVDVVAERIENLAPQRDQRLADLVTVRAVRLDGQMVDSVAGLLTFQGQLLFFGADVAMPADSRLVLETSIDLHPDRTSRLYIFRKRDII